MDFSLSEEHKMLQEAVREFAEKEIKPYGREYDEKKQYPMEIYKKAAKLGYIGASVPEEYDGAGMDCLAEAIISMEFCRADSSIGSAIDLATLGVPMVLRFGSEEQKEFVAKVVRGEGPSAIAVTEPDCGTDVAAMRTRAVKEGDEWVINGTKQFITNGSVGIYTVVLAKTAQVDPPHRGISAFLVEQDREGYEARPIEKMGMHCHDTCEVALKNVRVPADHLIGEENRGFYQLMAFFNESRVKIAALHTGIAIGAYERALEYAKERKAFGKPLIEHQAIQFKLAEMFKDIEAAKLLVFKAAWLIDQGKPDPALSSAAKLFASEMAVKVTYEAVQIFGGYGYSKEYDVERYYRDARVGTIYEGTSEAQKMVIARRIIGKIKV
ncbi:acyl-CoA dehydrogenase domain protein [Ferroglobus placidus DSM 10642]|uniref:Acyl-CoA dehydrogenase domain protein n=1 Tax=Ferroglobus placidus (strain DSM 10642 / AEDII12DO) TaxID=589924 RepID=D3RXF2_FERPA|nr:acyl-CoA dehydrogenase family protein [Ferroglobus placidus]ADC65165.1 acyl-CoA dehydrogenase domain protein [Ferroglobus placidus DSM 10642]